MKNLVQKSGVSAGHPTRTLLLTALLALGAVPFAHADRYRGDHNDRGRFEQRDRHDARPNHPYRSYRPYRPYHPYRSGNWVLDDRFSHNHYYPALGYSVPALPPGYLDIRFGRGRFFFSSGVWFRPHGRSFVVVTPPPGAYLPILPPDYTMVWIDNAAYYYVNGVYYAAAPAGGYVVAAPPADTEEVTQAPPPPPTMAPPPPPAYLPPGDDLMVYPKNGQSSEQTEADRAECTRWATNQTGYDPANTAPNDALHSDFQRAAGACLEGHGYTVK